MRPYVWIYVNPRVLETKIPNEVLRQTKNIGIFY